MLVAIEKDRAAKLLKEYFSYLSTTGYVRQTIKGRYLFWLFILYFVENVYPLLTENDYSVINNALIKLFSSGGCLLSYQFLPRTDVTVGSSLYMGSFSIRTTEENAWRATETSRIRAVED